MCFFFLVGVHTYVMVILGLERKRVLPPHPVNIVEIIKVENVERLNEN